MRSAARVARACRARTRGHAPSSNGIALTAAPPSARLHPVARGRRRRRADPGIRAAERAGDAFADRTMPLSRSRDLISSSTTESVCRELAACVKSCASMVRPAVALDSWISVPASAPAPMRMRACAPSGPEPIRIRSTARAPPTPAARPGGAFGAAPRHRLGTEPPRDGCRRGDIGRPAARVGTLAFERAAKAPSRPRPRPVPGLLTDGADLVLASHADARPAACESLHLHATSSAGSPIRFPHMCCRSALPLRNILGNRRPRRPSKAWKAGMPHEGHEAMRDGTQ